MRELYEGYAVALSEYLCMPLPPWFADQPHKDNWLAVARLRAQTEKANLPEDRPAPAPITPSALASLVDDHHDF
jgi:hypothetical protein